MKNENKIREKQQNYIKKLKYLKIQSAFSYVKMSDSDSNTSEVSREERNASFLTFGILNGLLFLLTIANFVLTVISLIKGMKIQF